MLELATMPLEPTIPDTADAQKLLEHELEYHYQDRALLVRALTHKSIGPEHNERLEFLGDAILGSIVAERLFRGCPDVNEGVLSRVRSSLVNWETLARAARDVGAAPAVIIHPSSKGPGDRVLADVAEALIGAALMDGGHEAAETVVEALIGKKLARAIDNPYAAVKTNNKLRLQITLQKHHFPVPTYTVREMDSEKGTHLFEATCNVKGFLPAFGRGKTVKEAERKAAKQFLAAYPW